MDFSQLPDISEFLVTPDNPPRDDLEGIDYVRCAALHNYLIHYTWLAEGRTLQTLKDQSSNFFTSSGAEAQAEALRPRLHSSVVSFLDNALVLPYEKMEDYLPLSVFAWAIESPTRLIEEFQGDLHDQPVNSLVRLYNADTPISTLGDDGAVIYHQHFNRVALFMSADDFDLAFPVQEHPEIWTSLETMLSHWIDLIRLGKVVASPNKEPALFEIEKVGPWEWRPYSEAQVTSCVAEWDRLCQAIEARITQVLNAPSLIDETCATGPETLATSIVLDAALLPNPSFARSFLTRARRPWFKSIAPGLLLPPVDPSAFVATQPFAVLPRSEYTVPPVCLFPADTRDQRPVHLKRITSPWLLEPFYSSSTQTCNPSHVSAGLYSEGVERNYYDMAEEGFRLLLPFTFNDGFTRSAYARQSDMRAVDRNGAGELFQHGFKPFGGAYGRPQRLERLLDRWRKLVEDGVWSVGPEGVKGTIDTFKDAETDQWKDCFIPPTW
ncbi:uncharacterized protein N7503_006137 [Penicillium pulvis]|uniref:uncharacterized protein n=1 Tax=Penicillium pulvis TaxID=1562058 RepID=UPI00254777DD|nr:uncharacterized protein N7503_006137 [Penicillium pulvis]KAJ5803687.1 hypothetical protein N7503_006137 [Penicillium pulvis]